MKTYRLKLTTHSGLLTPFQADTIFGHLCWVVAYRESDKGLKEFIQPFIDGKPPFLISDGFPSELLPKPLSADLLFAIDKRKDIKKIELIGLDAFNSFRIAEKFEIKKIQPLEYQTTPHSSINRETWSSLEGGLYNLEEYFVPDISIFIKTDSAEWKDKVVGLFETLAKSGYGSKKSIGKGQLDLTEVKEFNFKNVNQANGFVTLSSFCPKQSDPIEGLYKTFVKYGKLGEEFTFCGNPFKRPLLMFETGSVFKTNEKPKEYYGRMVTNIAPAKPEVVQYAYAFAIPIVYPKIS